jgi:hypothetical protein
MAISAQDYQRWFDTHWAGVSASVEKVTYRMQNIYDAYSSYSPHLLFLR